MEKLSHIAPDLTQKKKKKMEKPIDQVLSLSAATWGAEFSLTYYCLRFPGWETSAGISVRMIEVKE